MKKINVWYNGWGDSWQLGQLADNGQRIVFEYSQIALKKEIEFSPLHLKLSSSSYSDFPIFQMKLPGLIADSLPDGWGLLLMDKLYRKNGRNISEISPLDRLAYLGSRGMGALVYEPASIDKSKNKELSILEAAKEVQNIIRDKASEALPQLALIGGSPQGARPKVLVKYDKKNKIISTDEKLNSENLGKPWIIKFPAGEEHHEVCAIEALYLKVAKKAGLQTPEFEFFSLNPRLTAFGMERFDRKNELKILTHTAAGLLNADFTRASAVDYITFLKLNRFLTKDEREVLRGYHQCVFNVVFHNRDDHPKNFSFLLDEKNNWKMTPAYDLTFSYGPGGEHHMDICGEGKAPDRSHLLMLCQKSGLNLKKCKEIIEQVLDASSYFFKIAKEWPIRKSTLQTIQKEISLNVKRIKKRGLS